MCNEVTIHALGTFPHRSLFLFLAILHVLPIPLANEQENGGKERQNDRTKERQYYGLIIMRMKIIISAR